MRSNASTTLHEVCLLALSIRRGPWVCNAGSFLVYDVGISLGHADLYLFITDIIEAQAT
jgi:hypothetical protein